MLQKTFRQSIELSPSDKYDKQSNVQLKFNIKKSTSLSVLIDGNKKQKNRIIGTPDYIAPEIING